MIGRAPQRAVITTRRWLSTQPTPRPRPISRGYLDVLSAGGESDQHRLTVYGLAYAQRGLKSSAQR
jgi:hypothetical protein